MKERYLRKLFQAYYRSHHVEFPKVPDLTHREFAFLNWNRPGMVRHLSYPDTNVLTKFLVRSPPRHAYHSASYYTYPGATKMDQKGFLGCDLVFDIDSDHIPTPCRDKHNYVICKSCKTPIDGEKPDACPECGHTKFEKVLWICDDCLDVSKNQVFHLIDNFLLREFAIPLEEIRIFFSGHRGYHVHIPLPRFRRLDQDARREIADYLTGTGFSHKFWKYESTQNIMQGFSIHQNGWPGKIAQELLNVLYLNDQSVFDLFHSPRYGKSISPSIIQKILDDRTHLVKQLQQGNKNWNIIGVGDRTWIRIFEIIRDRIKADIDVVVSIDLHRLIRLNGSLHGKTGFRVMPVAYDHLKDFDPLREALSFPSNADNTLDLLISAPKAPPIRIDDQVYGPYLKGEKITLPLNAALFLLCKDVAELIPN